MNTSSPASARPLSGKTVLITGSARRVGLGMALAAASAGAAVVIHYNHSKQEALAACERIRDLGGQSHAIQAELLNPADVDGLIPQAINKAGPLFALVNNASIFEAKTLADTSLEDWNNNLSIHVSVPFRLSQAFAASLPPDGTGRIINMLDWRALRPGPHHFAYNVSKAGLAALTRASAAALAPRISVNGIALGAILPAEGQPVSPSLIKPVPMQRWGELDDVLQTFLFLLTGPAYITGEIIHVDGGRHLS